MFFWFLTDESNLLPIVEQAGFQILGLCLVATGLSDKQN